MVCVDTDFLIDLSNREEEALAKLKEIRARATPYTPQQVCEYTGAYRSRDKDRGGKSKRISKSVYL